MSKHIDNTGPAFPTSHSPDYPHEIVGGMTLRDAMAIASLKATSSMTWADCDFKPVNHKSIMENMALCAYQMADAMIAAREYSK